MDEVADDLIAQLTAIRRVTRRRLRPVVGGRALSGGQVELLRLVEVNAGISVGAAARELHLAGNSVSTLVNQLTRAGLLRREPDPADRRAARLLLTDAAGARLAAWRAARADLVATGLAALPAADRRRIAAALPALRHLAAALADPGAGKVPA